MFHARRGELKRVALIAGCVGGPNVRGSKQTRPMDERLDADVRALVSAGMPERERESCRDLGASLTPAQVASIAFEGGSIYALLPQGVTTAGKHWRYSAVTFVAFTVRSESDSGQRVEAR